MITYFYEHIRNSYFLNTNQVNNEFIHSLSRKSGVSIDSTQTLFSTIDAINGGKNVNDIELLQLNQLIQNFIKIKPDGRKFISATDRSFRTQPKHGQDPK